MQLTRGYSVIITYARFLIIQYNARPGKSIVAWQTALIQWSHSAIMSLIHGDKKGTRKGDFPTRLSAITTTLTFREDERAACAPS